MAHELALRGALGRALLGLMLGALSACGASNSPDSSSASDAGSAGSPRAPGTGGGASGGSSSLPSEGGAGTGGSASGGVSSAAGAGGDISSVPIAPGTELPIPAFGQVLGAQVLLQQLEGYDPGSLLRCDVGDDARYQAAIDALGGVTWGYNIRVLEDQSKPRYFAGVEKLQLAVSGAPTAGGDSRSVEIAKADVVAVTDAAALFYSRTHGVMIVAVEDGKPRFHCAAQLPGRVDQFFFHQGHLVVMTKSQDTRSSQLLHFTVRGTELRFVEAVNLGNVSVLDSRRFNEKLVFYTTFNPEASVTAPPSNPGSGAVPPGATPTPAQPAGGQHRALRVYELGDKLQEELYDTLLDTTESELQLFDQVDDATPLGTQVSESRSFGRSMWASDHYFVVTEQVSKTFLSGWNTNNYSVCTESHTVQSPYQYCWTEYETRPNPDYTEPDNSGGDRGCRGLTLSDCLVEVARVSNKTIQVPVARKCEERVLTRMVCDRSEQRSTTYPAFRQEAATQLFIYEYTEDGFVRVDSKVHEVTNSGLDAVSPEATVDVITTSTETYDLAVPGSIQTLYFQNGYLYVISQGLLQVYAMGGGSIVRTATLPVVNETLQSSLFSSDRLFLSDFGWRGGDHSTLRVVNLQNPAFPSVDGATHELPGGHRSIIASDSGIFTIGSVRTFMGQTVNALKLGLFSDPYAEETAYLILATDLKNAWLGTEESQFFNGASQRLALPYSGQNEQGNPELRVGLSRVLPGSIVSEGAVKVPELVDRVRPLATAEESYLTFATNSIEWLTPEGEEWKTEPVLEYLEPFGVYRRSKESEYVELQRLGTRCRLYFARASDINQRKNGAYSEEFFCNNPYATAYDRTLVFSTTNALEFADDHTFRLLSADEITETTAKIAERPYCLLELEVVSNVYIDPANRPADDQFTCMSPAEYNELRNRLATTNP